MMKTKYTIGLLLLLITKVLFAQNKTAITYQLNGYVSYENRGCNLINADITVNGNNKIYQTNTDSNGHFCLEGLERGFYDIIISIPDANKNHFDFFVYNSNVEAEYEILSNYSITFSCPRLIMSHYQEYLVKAPNQQIEALAAYQRGVDYRYSSTFNFGNTNEINIGK